MAILETPELHTTLAAPVSPEAAGFWRVLAMSIPTQSKILQPYVRTTLQVTLQKETLEKPRLTPLATLLAMLMVILQAPP